MEAAVRAIVLLACLALVLIGCQDGENAKIITRATKVMIGEASGLEPGEGRSAARSGYATSDVELISDRKGVGHRGFASAKRVLPQIYQGMEEDFYCGCRYIGKAVDLNSCGYVARKNENRASRIEWEHVVPASHLGLQQQCWQDGGRKNCSGKDAHFDQMEGDLNNLVPAVGEVNGDRGDMNYGAWTRTPEHVYGQCRSVPDFKNRRFQPREEVRGRAARISLYMYSHYGLELSRQDRKLWCGWAKTYPVDRWEQERDARIRKLQGEGNPLISDSSALAVLCG